MDPSRPPEHWPQRAGRRAPFPPGDGADAWEVVLDKRGAGAWVEYHVRSTGEVWRKEPDGYRAPPWWELPQIVRRAVWRAQTLRER